MNLSFSLPVSLPKAAFGGRVRSLYNDADAAQVNDTEIRGIFKMHLK